MENTLSYSIQIDVNNAGDEYRALLYRFLNNMVSETPGVFQYHTLGLDEQINKDNE